MQTIALIDYGAGNLRSVESALEAAIRQSQAEGGADARVALTDDPEIIRTADRIVLPGQGAFAACMDGLSAHEGVIEALEETVRARALPFLGICVGMQLLAETGLEHGEKAGLGWLGGICRPLQVGPFDTLPHMGWNQVSVRTDHPVLAPLAPKRHVYFCHSFVLEPAPNAILATAEHGESFCAAAGRDNIIGVQFHPEKSQAAGLALLAAFINWKP
jgi:glutamine amidotransferase